MDLAFKILLQVLAVCVAFTVNFLDYVNRDKRTRRFKLTLRGLFVLSAIFLLLSIFVVIHDEWTDNAKTENLQRELDRARQPLSQLHVTFRLDLSTEHDKLRDFHFSIRKTIEAAIKGDLADFLYISQRTPNGEILLIGIPPAAPLFPDAKRNPLFHFLLSYPGIQLNFYARGNNELSDPSKADLVVPVLAMINPRVPGSIQANDNLNRNGMLGIDVRNRRIFTHVSEWRVLSQHWIANGRIQSLPDLLDSSLVVRHRVYVSADIAPLEDIREVAKHITLNRLVINVSGRRFVFTPKNLAMKDLPDGSRSYVAHLSAGQKDAETAN